MAAKITDVARRAGVSMKTVSRVLNGEAHVRDEVRERVLAAAKELSYRPKVWARSLAGSRTFLVGYMLTLLSPYAVRGQLGALAACRRAGYHLVVETVDLAEPQTIQELGALMVDGMILLPPACDSEEVLDALDAAGTPYVRIAPETSPNRSAAVDVDDEPAARTMAGHLLGLGHRRIGFIQGPDGHAASSRRLRGFRTALAAAEVEPEFGLIEPGRFEFSSGYEAASRLLALPRPPTAVFAANDLMALGVIARAQELGLRIPQDLSVAGFDDMFGAALVWPGLTTMRQPMAEMAAAAAELIIAGAGKTAQADPPLHQTFSCELIVRGSTAPPPPRA